MHTLSVRLLTIAVMVPCVHPWVFSQVQQDTTEAVQDTAVISEEELPDFVPLKDRWREITPQPFELNVEGDWYDPYNQNVLKGDYPIIGQDIFLVLTLTADNFLLGARVPTPSGVSTLNAVSPSFFGSGERLFVNENLKVSVEIYEGQTAFRPRGWELKVTAVGNLNYANLRENNNVNINVRKGDDRTDNAFAFQELSLEKHLFDISDRYDFISVKAGIQPFGSDFRRFVFDDFNLGARLFGNAASNRIQYNVIFLPVLEKETNSELNTIFDDREQDVLIANVYIQDFIALGYTTQLSFHYNHDKPTTRFDNNGVPVRPPLVGNTQTHDIKAYYVGWAGDGHLGWLNVSHAFYYVFGKDSFNPLAGQPIDLSAQMAALELSFDQDWMRFKVSGFYASGDDSPTDNKGKGFDAIVDHPFFAGGPFSYWNSQGIRLLGVNLKNRLSLLPNLRPSKFEAQANFVNPGVYLANVGFDAELTPKIKAILNVNYLRFVNTSSLQLFLNQNAIRSDIGVDYSLGIIYRPFLNNNIIWAFGFAGLTPLSGFRDIFDTSQTQFSFFTSLILTY